MIKIKDEFIYSLRLSFMWPGRWLLTGGLILISWICNYNYPRHNHWSPRCHSLTAEHQPTLTQLYPEQKTHLNWKENSFLEHNNLWICAWFCMYCIHLHSYSAFYILFGSHCNSICHRRTVFKGMYLLFITLTPHSVLGAIFSLTLIRHRRPQKDNHLARGARTQALHYGKQGGH